MAVGRTPWGLLLLLFLVLVAAPAAPEPKGASITLKAKWNSTPLLLEAAEFLAEEDTTLLWRFIDAWHMGKAASQRACWEQISDAAAELLSPSMTKVMQVAVGIRQASPRIELFRTEAETAGIPSGSCAFADFGSKQAKNPAELRALIADIQSLPIDAVPIYDFDHALSASGEGSSSPSVTAVLYGSIGTEAFWEMHRLLARAAEAPLQEGSRHLRYIYRPVLLDGCLGAESRGGERCFELGTGDMLQLPGFGVEMAIKNMEYSALDEKQIAEEKAASEGDSGLEEQLPGGEDPLASSLADEELKVWDLKDLGVQAAQRIGQAADPLRSLVGVSQNFPNLAGALSRTKLDKAVRKELQQMQDVLPGGATFMLLNGMFMDPEVDLYEMFARVRKEVRLAEQLQCSRLQAATLMAVLGLRAQAEALDAQSLRLDLFSSGQVVFVNDLEKQRQYRSWGWSLMMLMQPMFPGSLPRVGRNVFSLVFVIDPGTLHGLRLARYAHDLVAAGQWPLRIGILLTPSAMLGRLDTDGKTAADGLQWDALTTGEKAAGLFNVLRQNQGALEALSFLASIKPSSADDASTDVDWADVAAGFGSAAEELGVASSLSVISEEVSVSGLAEQAAAVHGLGLGSKTNSMWLNGMPLPEAASSLQTKLSIGMQLEMQRLQEIIYFGILEDTEEDIPGFLMKYFKAVPRFNPRILDAAGESAPEQLALTGKLAANAEPFASLGHLHHPGTEDGLKGVTHWVAMDVETQAGKKVLREALLHLKNAESSASRLAILQHSQPGRPASVLSRAIAAAAQLPARRSKIPDFLINLVARGNVTEEEVRELAERSGLNNKALQTLLNDRAAISARLSSQAEACRQGLGLEEGEAAVVTNGRVLLAHSPARNISDGLVAADFLLLDHYASTAQLAQKVTAEIEAALSHGLPVLQAQASSKDAAGDGGEEGGDLEEATAEQLSDAALVASSVLAAHLAKDPYRVQGQVEQVIQAIKGVKEGNLSFSVLGGQESVVQVTAVLDPLSKTGQQLSALLSFLRSTLQPMIKVHLNPRQELSKLPLTSFYRMALPDFSGPVEAVLHLPAPPVALFQGLPSTKVLTLHMDVPEAWLVEPVRAAHDLDNLRLSDLGKEMTLHAEFELEALLLTGSCTDTTALKREQVTPRGVQLHLGTSQHPHLVDTLVMSNLGYYQLKAAPGVYKLQLAPGRSQQLYTVIQPNGTGRLSQDEDSVSLPVVIDSLQGKSQRLRLQKRPGYENADVLEEPEQGGLLSEVSGWFGGSKGSGVAAARGEGGKLSPENDPDTIHIFTIASGHMYERLQKIMILSLIRNTKSRIKVWFIKNYMSPQMKRFLPHMARHYDFDYEFVTYKWPSWLHKQTEKQRIIWAYKILFLDVLFPLNLRKVIFADSDQIMRADFRELWKMDLKGAPLAYTPFCDNNKDMDGFRFWKQGFWKDHLRGRPYHISALYVVDLAKFRQMAAGDQLRIVYEQLSKDPNSLANLDQDLPNYAQHMVPIHSLPQEWLWCETWCGNETKPAAKTIDLCNNPLTKEPKLRGARRIVTEWPALDAEAQAVTAEIEEQLSRQAQAEGAAFDARDLSLSSKTQEETLAAADSELSTQEPDSGEKGGPREQRQFPHDASEL